MNYAEELKNWRKTYNLTQKELSEKTGLSQQSISVWENGKISPTIDSCIILANFYNISIDELIGRDYTGYTRRT